jgi:hypothetical protein
MKDIGLFFALLFKWLGIIGSIIGLVSLGFFVVYWNSPHDSDFGIGFVLLIGLPLLVVSLITAFISNRALKKIKLKKSAAI